MVIDFIKDSRISSGMGARWGRIHKGIDFAIPSGSKVQSTTAGEVVYTGNDPDGYGNYIKVEDSRGNTHIYAHLSAIEVTKGQHVAAGEEIAKSGSTGRSTGPHVHYEVRNKNGVAVNGLEYLGISKDTGVIGSSEVTETDTVTSTENTGYFSNKFTGLAKNIVLALSLMILIVAAGFFLFKVFNTKGGK